MNMNAALVLFEVFVREWLRESSVVNEDGERVILSDFQVIARAENGAQFEHIHRFIGRAQWEDEGGHYGVRVQHGDKAAAERLVAKIERHLAAGGQLNLDNWVRIEGAYGSEAWQEEDAGGFYAYQERVRDMEAEYA